VGISRGLKQLQSSSRARQSIDERAEKFNQRTSESEAMTIETPDLTTSADVSTADQLTELFALSIEDLDLVGGGTSVGIAI
jgi:hypothetical protein